MSGAKRVSASSGFLVSVSGFGMVDSIALDGVSR
jgi:hypothetical protein